MLYYTDVGISIGGVWAIHLSYFLTIVSLQESLLSNIQGKYFTTLCILLVYLF